MTKKFRIIEGLVFVIVALNFVFGPTAYTWFKTLTYSRQNGIEVTKLLEHITTNGMSYVDGLEKVIYSGREELKLWGWAFLNIDGNLSPADYDRTIVLFSDRTTYPMDLWSVPRKGVEDHFSHLGLNLENSGFTTTFSSDLVLPGIYKIGILFKDRTGDEYFLLTDRVIEKTNNSIGLK